MPRAIAATMLGLAGFVAYVAVAVVLADRVTVASWPMQLLYFIVAGSLWVLPAWGLMLWAARGRKETPG